MELHNRAGGLGGLREGFTEVYVQYYICDFLSSRNFPHNDPGLLSDHCRPGVRCNARGPRFLPIRRRPAAPDVLG
jgi:hypothetical protein